MKEQEEVPGRLSPDLKSPVLMDLRHRIVFTPIQIMIADEDKLFTEGIVALISQWSEFQMVAKAATYDEVLRHAVAYSPSIILMGVRMQSVRCSEIIHAIYEKHLDPYFVVVASHNDAADILEVLRAGATGYGIREGLSADRLRGILWGVAAGEIVLSGPVTSLRTGLLEQEKKPLPEYAFFQDLTKREREVLVFLVEGMSNAEISHQLFLSEPTVKKIIGRITEKLQVSNRVQAAVLAARYMMTHKL